MTKKIHLRELLAWITLVLAVIMFGISVSYAQTKNIEVKSDNGKVHLKVERIENGKHSGIDTTFIAGDDQNIDKLIESMTGDIGLVENSINQNGKQKAEKLIIKKDVIDLSGKEMEKIQDEINEAMEKLNTEMNKMKNSISKLHININSDNGDSVTMNFNFKDEAFDDISSSDLSGLSGDDKHLVDSLDDENYFIINGDENENPPVIEKVITGKGGKKIFVYKRSAVENATGKNALGDLKNLSIFPNPSDGKFKIEFYLEQPCNVKIQILDENKKKVYEENLKNVNGNYSGEINLSNLAKGNYALKISNDKTILIRTILLN